MHSTDSLHNEEAASLHSILLDVQLDKTRQDKWVWTLEASKVFFVRSLYRWLVNCDIGTGLNSGLNRLIEKVWRIVTPSKVSIFGWPLLRNSLPKRDNLHHRQVIVSEEEARCPFCLQQWAWSQPC